MHAGNFSNSPQDTCARYIPLTARLFAESFTPSISLKSSGTAQRPFSGNRILTSQPPATKLFQPLCGISKGVQKFAVFERGKVAALFNAAILGPFAGRRTCRRRRTSPTPASSPPSSRRGRSGRSSATPSRGPSSGAPSSKPRLVRVQIKMTYTFLLK